VQLVAPVLDERVQKLAESYPVLVLWRFAFSPPHATRITEEASASACSGYNIARAWRRGNRTLGRRWQPL
jgi:hypothetical protein